VDFNKISPLKAIARLNKKFNLRTWTSDSGYLYVGYPETNSQYHMAAPDDSRVWRYKDPQISHGREPIKSVVVEGALDDDPGIGDLANIEGWFKKQPDAMGLVVATGFATRTDIDYGKTFSVRNTGAKRDGVDEVAEAALRERMKRQNTGTITLDPELSGDSVSEIRDLRCGDLLHLIPDDSNFETPNPQSGTIGNGPDSDDICNDYVNNEIYIVNSVEHRVTDSGNWMVNVDIAMLPDAPVESFVRYFDPKSEQYLNEEEVFKPDLMDLL
jgi:hypothetical protein